MRVSLSATALGLLAAAAVALALSTSLSHPVTKPNVLLITIDTLRADHLSCYGSTKVRTPVIDGLAAQGVLFEHAYTDVTWTTPSMASVMTGVYAPKHGVQTSYQRLPQSATTLAEYLQRDGFDTGAVIASFPLYRIFGFDQGFRSFDANFSAPSFESEQPSPDSEQPSPAAELPRFGDDRDEVQDFILEKFMTNAYRLDDQVTDAAIAWLNGRHHEPFLLWVHYFGPHEEPQGAPDIWEEVRRQLAQYDDDVVTVDREVGRLLDVVAARKLLSRTMIILHADHGQSLMEHDYFGHGSDVYDPTQRVPLIIRPPGGLATATRVAQMVRNLDIMPTVLALMGMEPPERIDGRSLLPALTGSPIEAPEETYVETYLSANHLFAQVIDPKNDVRLGFRRLGIRTPQWKYIVNDPVPFADQQDPPPITNEMRRQYYSEELYDLASDPGEMHNVVAAHKDLAAGFLHRVWENQPRSKATPDALPIGGTTRERLKSLGYVD